MSPQPSSGGTTIRSSLAFLKPVERGYRHVLDDGGDPVELHLMMDNKLRRPQGPAVKA